MRLKTKFQDEDFDLGEVVEANIYHGGNGGVKVIAEPTKGGMITFYFKTLKGLNEMFEDYEEPKEWWYIDIHGPHKVTNNDEYYQQVKVASKEIGNYFESLEEAEQAVEKLKAWKRLKDKGFRFDLSPALGHCDDKKFDISIIGTMPAKWWYNDKVVDDIHYIFGGEDE